jgi:hypothetical protein
MKRELGQLHALLSPSLGPHGPEQVSLPAHTEPTATTTRKREYWSNLYPYLTLTPKAAWPFARPTIISRMTPNQLPCIRTSGKDTQSVVSAKPLVQLARSAPLVRTRIASKHQLALRMRKEIQTSTILIVTNRRQTSLLHTSAHPVDKMRTIHCTLRIFKPKLLTLPIKQQWS